jgi:hypothetical protein
VRARRINDIKDLAVTRQARDVLLFLQSATQAQPEGRSVSSNDEKRFVFFQPVNQFLLSAGKAPGGPEASHRRRSGLHDNELKQKKLKQIDDATNDIVWGRQYQGATEPGATEWHLVTGYPIVQYRSG